MLRWAESETAKERRRAVNARRRKRWKNLSPDPSPEERGDVSARFARLAGRRFGRVVFLLTY